jgi:hypothetical protein
MEIIIVERIRVSVSNGKLWGHGESPGILKREVSHSELLPLENILEAPGQQGQWAM